MRGCALSVIAEPEPEFSAWLKRQAEPARQPPAGSAQKVRLPKAPACSRKRNVRDCHAISGTGAKGASWPGSDPRAQPRISGRGNSKNNSETMALWVTNPQAAKPGNRMPDTPLSD